MCVLCRDTFSRSDILKRHFQKCSIRRGNPTGASHLSHPQAHVKKNAQSQKAAGLGNEGDMNHMNGMGNMPADGMVQPFGMVPVQDGMNSMAGDQNHLSRSSSMGRLENGNNQDRRTMPGNPSVMGHSQPYGGDVQGSMNSQHMPGYNMPPGQNGMPMYGGSSANQQSGLDWSQMFQAGAHQTFASNCNSSPPNVGQTQNAIRTEPNADPGTTAVNPGANLEYSSWGVPSTLQNPYSHLSNEILNFFYPPNQAIDPQMSGMNLYFSPDNIKEFLDQFTHFSVHVPLLHVPTFRIMEAYTGLLAGMCCIGACYSDRVDAAHVREMMDFLWDALERDCKVMSRAGLSGPGIRVATKPDIEELQTVLLMVILNIWNGTPKQRDRARQTFPLLAAHARKFNLLQVSNDTLLRSALHQPDCDLAALTTQEFHWEDWIEQERRVRLMCGILLADSMMGMYFNIAPQLDPFEIHLPLPADDAAWDADDSTDCVSSLGLCGADAAQSTNPYGTRQAKQPQLDWALQALLNPSVQLQSGSTNLYGKFILIHVIITLIRRAQIDGSAAAMHTHGTPPPQNWMVSAPGDSSGRATPVNGVGQGMDSHSLKALCTALDKFKVNWDADMNQQFPPAISMSNNKRQGFSRDGIHFYWLAKYTLKYTQLVELQLVPDARLMQVMQLLKGVRTWVMSDGAARGEELGSVGEIDDHYGATTDLTLDMAQLFKPLPRVVEDSRTASVKTDFGTAGAV